MQSFPRVFLGFNLIIAALWASASVEFGQKTLADRLRTMGAHAAVADGQSWVKHQPQKLAKVWQSLWEASEPGLVSTEHLARQRPSTPKATRHRFAPSKTQPTEPSTHPETKTAPSQALEVGAENLAKIAAQEAAQHVAQQASEDLAKIAAQEAAQEAAEEAAMDRIAVPVGAIKRLKAASEAAKAAPPPEIPLSRPPNAIQQARLDALFLQAEP